MPHLVGRWHTRAACIGDCVTQDTGHRVRLGGRVQGVGFRPFVYRLARREGLTGWVRNLSGQVEILAQGPNPALQRFTRSLLTQAPPLARPTLLSVTSEIPSVCQGFWVHGSDATQPADEHLPPDQFTCDDCLRELGDPHDRRYRYPFINCTQCGPRYTLITALPYDRPNTDDGGLPALRRLCGGICATRRTGVSTPNRWPVRPAARGCGSSGGVGSAHPARPRIPEMTR